MQSELLKCAAPTDVAENFRLDGGIVDFLDKGKARWEDALHGSIPILRFWHRESPDYLVNIKMNDTNLLPGVVEHDEPPPTTSGMLQVTLDARGRLLDFEAVAPQKSEAPASATAPDWKQLFAMAGLDPAQFKSAEPLWTPLSATDTRAAWTGVWPGTQSPLRVEAASYGGKPVFFSLIGDWTRATRMRESNSRLRERIAQIVLACFSVLVIFGAVLVARRNFLKERIDSEGAWRLAVLYFGMQFAVFILSAHFVPTIATLGLFLLDLSGALFGTAVVTIIYLALEPYIRRHWAHSIISWSRLMSGHISDHNVGRDILYGILLGLSWGVLYQVLFLFLGKERGLPNFMDVNMLRGGHSMIGTLIAQIMNSVRSALAFFFFMFLLRVLLRKGWLAAVVFVAFFTATKVLQGSHVAFVLPLQLAIYSIAAFVVLRFGLIALITGIFAANIILNIPLTPHLSKWYMSSGIYAIVLLLALAFWAAYTSLGGQKVWREHLFD